MTSQPEHVVVVGAGLGGLRTVEQLRAGGHGGQISLVGAEPHPPYDRPPLSKQVLTGEWEPARAVLRDPDALDELGVRSYRGLAAVALRPGEVELADGASLYGDAIVVATGVTARRLPGQPAHARSLRTLDDALEVRADLGRAGSLLVVGGGFIGAEVASAARLRGIDVTVLEAQPEPFTATLGPEVGTLCARLGTDAGVALRLGAAVASFLDAGERIGLALADGEQVEADAAVVGVGSVVAPEWLADSGLATGGGIACDARGRVEGAGDAVWAVGDIAAWRDPVHGDRYRTEHWASAGDQATVVARDILGAPPPPPTVPYFWSDQFGLKIQVFGRPELADAVVPLHGDGLAGGPVRGTVAGYTSAGRLVGVVGFGAPGRTIRYRARLGWPLPDRKTGPGTGERDHRVSGW